ncbi:hypothetical protein SU69_08545 [Thermosipho melanesiensis]|uniref:Uncharacterized protein n=2 Tax=Thermosipho melanesiensis TaxID=46541 RepID=A6LNM8_THEM4|nr:hypothetical protein [Thermosipho melanesiensis]ABR31529.1 hypothetical protein Tmel_1687 [Thermosipho melanesiensis BI429]APT74570.1 hypothetical protein BW47_08920 [Thermosipho melanesiensis]OOC35274.1 hypothetical protein SU69_08545 [Thermosipho melanesiensis]OOC35493.1 hypothetical protein SU70_08555 [Thermosipho melanesiensis]OOC36529.1 hypothetical protein SU68_08610 [Thermosipho melanesiensis]
MFKSSTSKLYESLEKMTYSKFGEKEGEEVFNLLWEIFSEYTTISASEENKFIDKAIKLIDDYFENGR